MKCPRTICDSKRSMHWPGVFLVSVVVFSTLALSLQAEDDQPLHQRIDTAITEAHFGPLAPNCSDEEFLRRVYLDLNGHVPPVDELRAFLADTSTGKRVTAIDRLLNDVQYARHMAVVFDVMLMERRAETHVKTPEWRQYLERAFLENKPYDQLAREILAADGVDPAMRPAARFYLDRLGEPNLLTREVGRMFFGRDLQCAQCHDHPTIDDYRQTEYYGLFAFLSRSYLFTDKDKKAFYAEKAEGDVKFRSVFDADQVGRTNPALPGGPQLAEPRFKLGEEYEVKPADKVRPIPKYSRRAQLAAVATRGDNLAFNRNIVNRLWAHMMGRGIVHPVDLHHSENPPSHPELLDDLALHFVATKYDIKSFLRELALSKTYQRSFEMPANTAETAKDVEEQLTSLQQELEQLQNVSDETETSFEQPLTEYEAARTTTFNISEEYATSQSAVAAAHKPASEAAKALTDATSKLTARRDFASTLKQAAESSQSAASKLAEAEPLTQAAAVFAKRAEQTASEVAQLDKQVGDLQSKATATAAKLSEAESAADAVYQRLSAARDALAMRFESYHEATRAIEKAQTTANLAEHRLAIIESLRDYSQSLVDADQAAADVEQARAEKSKAEASMPAAMTEVAQAKAALPPLEQALAAATAELAQVEKTLTEKQDILVSLNEAVAKLEAVKQKLPEDAEIEQSRTTLIAKVDQWKTEVTAADQLKQTEEAEAKAAADHLMAATDAVSQAQKKVDDLRARLDELTTRAADAVKAVDASQAASDAKRLQLTDAWSARFAVRSLEPLAPEQLAWSIMHVLGVADRQYAATRADYEKKHPLTDDIKNDAAKMTVRENEIERQTWDALNKQSASIVRLFGAAAGQPQDDFFATVDQALYFSNGGQLNGWLAPSGKNLTERLGKTDDPQALAEELYLSVLSRLPLEAEIKDVTDYLENRKDERAKAVQELVWALLTSSEFRFNH